MSEAYLGEIRMFAGNFAPVDWAICDGRTIAISGNEALYALIGTTYGGDGQNTFCLPDLRGRSPIHKSVTNPFGSNGGVESVQLTSSQMPVHTHSAMASSAAGTLPSPTNAVWTTSTYSCYSTNQAPTTAMNPQAISASGGSQPHDNMMPFVVINYIICLAGIYPTFIN